MKRVGVLCLCSLACFTIAAGTEVPDAVMPAEPSTAREAKSEPPATVSSAPGTVEVTLPTKEDVEDAVPVGTAITGKQIYERARENRMASGIQYQRMISTDPSGAEQSSRFWVRWKDYRDENNKPVDGVVAKTVIKFLDPFDMRHTGMLVIVNADGEPEQFLYQPSTRKVRRVRLQGGIGGSDFSFNDIAFESIEAADYERMPDEEIDGVPVYVVESTLKPFVTAEYRTTIAKFEQEHYIPLYIKYLDEFGTPIRESHSKHSSIKQFGDTWVATESIAYNLKEETSSRAYVEKLEPNVELADNLFSIFRLQLNR